MRRVSLAKGFDSEMVLMQGQAVLLLVSLAVRSQGPFGSSNETMVCSFAAICYYSSASYACMHALAIGPQEAIEHAWSPWWMHMWAAMHTGLQAKMTCSYNRGQRVMGTAGVSGYRGARHNCWDP